MDLAGAGRARGFRAQGANETGPRRPAPAADPTITAPAPPDVLETGPPRRPKRQRQSRAQSKPPRWLLAVTVPLVLAIAVLAFLLGSASSGSVDRASAPPTPTPAAPATPLPVPALYRQTVPSVVLITTSKGSLGSGTVVTDTGTVLTAAHVVSGGGSVSVLFADGTKAAATVASTDKAHDIATLTPKKLPEVVVAATLGGEVVVGADVVAIGNPLGLRNSTTTGVVSGVDRASKAGANPVSGLIQFDAAVNPGSSGGPLLDSHGLVVGVVVSIADPGEDDAFAGIGFAVPIGAVLAGGSGTGQGGGPLL